VVAEDGDREESKRGARSGRHRALSLSKFLRQSWA
jgi:hypothetical protein